jgi:Tfp pilus assembly protein PilO
MTRFITPLILVGLAVALFVIYTDPAFQATKKVKAEVDAYDSALTKSQELKAVRGALQSKRNAFKTEDLQKLEKVLPDNVDNIRLIIDIDNIATRRGVPLRNVQLGQISDSGEARDPLAVGDSGSPIGSVELTFNVSATYEDFLALLADLEHSLRIVDIESISFDSPAEGELAEYSITIRTYWLR